MPEKERFPAYADWKEIKGPRLMGILTAEIGGVKKYFLLSMIKNGYNLAFPRTWTLNCNCIQVFNTLMIRKNQILACFWIPHRIGGEEC